MMAARRLRDVGEHRSRMHFQRDQTDVMVLVLVLMAGSVDVKHHLLTARYALP